MPNPLPVLSESNFNIWMTLTFRSHIRLNLMVQLDIQNIMRLPRLFTLFEALGDYLSLSLAVQRNGENFGIPWH